MEIKNNKLKKTWSYPIEDQNNDFPPKRAVEELFKQHGKNYRDTIDAPAILSVANYHEIAKLCPQCFKPFIEFLEQI